ncbi:MAG: MerR family transcriptional regulator [Chloroflexi bacterium]|nr:MerR family transcriptional regulator [Chloroflexota bacterium]
MEEKKYTIDQLGELTGYKRRTIRYYVQQGILEPPAGRGRGGFYNDSHLKRLSEMKALRERGMGLAETVACLQDGVDRETPFPRQVWARYEIVPGLELHLSRDMEDQAGARISRIVLAIRSILEGGKEP